VQLLLKLKAKVNARGDDGQTALHIAAMLGHLDCVKVLYLYMDMAAPTIPMDLFE
jgi:ankyrin repeat protein